MEAVKDHGMRSGDGDEVSNDRKCRHLIGLDAEEGKDSVG